jgi:aldehyde:ferredoxin oxidoreductase
MLYNSIMGTRLNQYRFRRNGKRIHLLERYMNCREGLSSADDTLPERFLKEHRESDPYKRVIKMKTMLRKYYWYRGYDRTGIPGSKTLKRWKVLINA